MAVANSPNPSRLTMVQHVGNNEEGRPIYRSKSFSNVKWDATDEDLYQVAAVLAALSEHPTVRIERTNNSVLSEV